MIIGLFGKTCTGKSSVSDALAIRLELSVRHCGDAVRGAAKKLGVMPVDLPLDIHRQLDADTRSLAVTNVDALIDGTFLDFVLYGVPRVLLIELICADQVREHRNVLRGSVMTAAERDAIDSRLRRLLYSESLRASPSCVIDTTALTIDATARAVADEVARVL